MSQRSEPRPGRDPNARVGDQPPGAPERLRERSAGDWVGAITESEDEYVLREIDRVRDELAPRFTSPPRSRSVDDQHPWGAPSPYLEERLNVARSVAAQLAAEASSDRLAVPGLKSALQTIDQELGRATEELGFARTEVWDEGYPDEVAWRVPGPVSPLPAHPLVTAPSVSGPAPRVAASGRVGPPTGSFEDYTVARYNRTVAELHSRRRPLAWWTVAAAAVISSALLYLTLRAHEPVPPIWLAALPLVWMIPVPFFIAGFRGTQRILDQNRLELPDP